VAICLGEEEVIQWQNRLPVVEKPMLKEEKVCGCVLAVEEAPERCSLCCAVCGVWWWCGRVGGNHNVSQSAVGWLCVVPPATRLFERGSPKRQV